MATVTLRMTGYSDTPLIVTLLAAPKGVTVCEEVCLYRVLVGVSDSEDGIVLWMYRGIFYS